MKLTIDSACKMTCVTTWTAGGSAYQLTEEHAEDGANLRFVLSVGWLNITV